MTIYSISFDSLQKYISNKMSFDLLLNQYPIKNISESQKQINTNTIDEINKAITAIETMDKHIIQNITDNKYSKLKINPTNNNYEFNINYKFNDFDIKTHKYFKSFLPNFTNEQSILKYFQLLEYNIKKPIIEEFFNNYYNNDIQTKPIALDFNNLSLFESNEDFFNYLSMMNIKNNDINDKKITNDLNHKKYHPLNNDFNIIISTDESIDNLSKILTIPIKNIETIESQEINNIQFNIKIDWKIYTPNTNDFDNFDFALKSLSNELFRKPYLIFSVSDNLWNNSDFINQFLKINKVEHSITLDFLLTHPKVFETIINNPSHDLLFIHILDSVHNNNVLFLAKNLLDIINNQDTFIHDIKNKNNIEPFNEQPINTLFNLDVDFNQINIKDTIQNIQYILSKKISEFDDGIFSIERDDLFYDHFLSFKLNNRKPSSHRIDIENLIKIIILFKTHSYNADFLENLFKNTRLKQSEYHLTPILYTLIPKKERDNQSINPIYINYIEKFKENNEHFLFEYSKIPFQNLENMTDYEFIDLFCKHINFFISLKNQTNESTIKHLKHLVHFNFDFIDKINLILQNPDNLNRLLFKVQGYDYNNVHEHFLTHIDTEILHPLEFKYNKFSNLLSKSMDSFISWLENNNLIMNFITANPMDAAYYKEPNSSEPEELKKYHGNFLIKHIEKLPISTISLIISYNKDILHNPNFPSHLFINPQIAKHIDFEYKSELLTEQMLMNSFKENPLNIIELIQCTKGSVYKNLPLKLQNEKSFIIEFIKQTKENNLYLIPTNWLKDYDVVIEMITKDINHISLIHETWWNQQPFIKKLFQKCDNNTIPPIKLLTFIPVEIKDTLLNNNIKLGEYENFLNIFYSYQKVQNTLNNKSTINEIPKNINQFKKI